jgi:hypothetical protein
MNNAQDTIAKLSLNSDKMKKLIILLAMLVVSGCATPFTETRGVLLPVIHTIQNSDSECCRSGVESCTGETVICNNGSISDCTCREEMIEVQIGVR